MKKFLHLFCAWCLFHFGDGQSRADSAGTNSPPRLTVELRDGSRVVGTSATGNFRFHSELFGPLKLAVQDIRSVECVASNSLTLGLANGDSLKVSFADPELAIKTSFGGLSLPVTSIRRLTVRAAGATVARRDGLVGFWAGDGNADDSFAGNNGSLMGGAAFAAGPAGQTFNFDPAGGFVKIPRSSTLDPGSQVTVEFWMNAAPDNSMSHYQGLVTSDFYGVEISNGYGGNMGVNFFVNLTANRSPQRNDWSRHNFNNITSVGDFTHVSDANGGGAPVSPGQWHHVAATYDGTQLKLYLDGQLWGRPVFQSGVITPMLPGSFVAIGSEDGRLTCPDCAGNRYFQGQIRRVAIYRRALSPEEIHEDYAAEKGD